jgi:hypothetical protein
MRMIWLTIMVWLSWNKAIANTTSTWSPALVVELGVRNDGQKTLVLDEVGVESRLDKGDFGCKSSALALPILADYHVTFLVAEMTAKVGDIRKTMKPAIPPLSIPKQEVGRFRVSTYPDALGACGEWTASIRVALKFSNGTRVASEWRTITSREVEELSKKGPKPVEIVRFVLCNPDRELFKYWFVDGLSWGHRKKVVVEGVDQLSRTDLTSCDGSMRRVIEQWVVSFLNVENASYSDNLRVAGFGGRCGFDSITPFLEKEINAKRTDRDMGEEIRYQYCMVWKKLNEANGRGRFDKIPKACRPG